MKILSVLSALTAPKTIEVSGTYTLCIPCEGEVQRYQAATLYQAETMLNEWLLAGWPAWIEDNKSNVIHSIATTSDAIN
jgi:hypothetical protein